MNKIIKWLVKQFGESYIERNIDKESELTGVIEHIINDFNFEAERLERQKEVLSSNNKTLEQEIEFMKRAIAMKHDEQMALNSKLNTYTMDNSNVMRRMHAEVYMYNPKDLELEDGVSIETQKLIELLDSFNMKPITYIDADYFSIEKETVEKLIELNNKGAKSDYIRKKGHDAYAFILKGMFLQDALKKYIFGWARSNNNTFNFFIDKNNKIWVVEPKNSSIMDYETILRTRLKEEDLDYKISSYLL